MFKTPVFTHNFNKSSEVIYGYKKVHHWLAGYFTARKRKSVFCLPFELCAVAFDPRRRSFRRVFALYRERTRQGKIQRSHSLFTICPFSSEVTVSLFALSAVSYNRKRWFYRNASEKAPVSYLFAGEKFSVRLKVFYFFFFKKLMTALCLVAAEIPFLLCSLVFYRELSEKGLYKTVFAGAVVLCSVLFCSDCTSARFFRKHFGCAKRYTSKTKNAP